MLVVYNRIPVAEGFEDAFEDRFRNRAGLVDKAPGFVRNEILRPKRPGLPYQVVTYWEDEASFNAWVNSDAFREAHRDRPPEGMFAGENHLEIHEVIFLSER